ncbi:MAG: TonB-dependent receptor [Saprospiraceae bacterium]|nr:TonB-dependent receptor [Saprospiraceae bacterium]
MKHAFLLMLLAVSFSLSAQLPFGGMSAKGTGKMSGGIIDSMSRQPIEYVSVALRKAGQSDPIDGIMTDNKGMFRFKELKNGKYDVFITFLGYDDKIIRNVVISDSLSDQMLGRIFLSPSSKMLDEVVVKGEQGIVENKIDRMVYNAGKDVTNKGGNAADVLRKVPTLSVDLDGNLSMRGSQSIRVLINGKPSAVMASNVADALKMIPSDEIDKVEVLTSPGAKYDAEGSAGIVNIITKRKTIKGVSGNVNISAGTRSAFAGANVTLKMDKVSFTAGAGGFGWRAKGNLLSERIAGDYLLTQSGRNDMNGLGGRGNLGIDYDITDKDNIAASATFGKFGMHLNNSIVSNQSFAGITNQHYRRDQDSENNNYSTDVNLDYKHKFKKENQELTLSGQYSNNYRPTHYEINQLNDADILNYQEQSNNKGTNREITAQADYSHPFSKNFTLDLGVKSIFRRIESNFVYDTTQLASGAIIRDEGRSNEFGYLQNVMAGYTEGTWNITSQIGLKAGVRYEKTTIEGDIFKDTHLLNNTYANLMPSGTLSYKWGSNGLKVSYNQRLQRPSLFYLNPYTNEADPKNITVGNPKLNAELSHNVELGYNKFFGLSSVNIAVYRRFTNNAIEAVRLFKGDTMVTTYFNQANNTNTGLNISGNVMKGYKFMVGGNIDVSYVEAENKTLGINNTGINYGVNGFLNWTIYESWGIQAYGGFRGPTITSQGKSTSFYFYGIGAKRDLLNKKATLSIGLDNPFTPYQKMKTELNVYGAQFKSVSKFYAFGGRISFNWMFGKMSFSNKKGQGIENNDLKKGGDGQGMGGQGMGGSR